MLELKLLGLPKLFFKGEELAAPGAKAFALLCYLACQSEAVHRKSLAELLWNKTSTASVRVALSELRNLEGADSWLITDGQLLSLNAKTDLQDLKQNLSLGDYQKALSIWNEETDPQFLKGLEVKKAPEFDDWVAIMRSQLTEQHTEILRGQLEQLQNNKNYTDALDIARQILAKDKLDEDTHRTIMQLEHARGNTDGAIKQFESLKQTLKQELDVEPLPETQALLQDIERSSVSSGKTAIILEAGSDIPALPEKLIGRDDLLEEIDETLKTQNHILLHGFGGTGKSAVAASYAKHWLETKPPNSKTSNTKILWLQAGDDTAETLFDAIAKTLNAQNQLNQTQNPTETLKDLLNQNTSLLILDDAWNAYALEKLQAALPENLPLIVTARQRHNKLKRIDIGRLKREDALELLEYQAKQNLKTNKHADILCNLLGDHPLAVRIAGLTLQAEETTPKALLNNIKDNPHSMKTPEEFAEEGRESVGSLLASTAKTLSDPAYEALLACGSLHSTSTTPEFLSFALRRDEEDTEDALIELQKRGLTERQSQAGSDIISYRLHDLVFSFAKINTNLRATTIMQAGKTFLTNHKRNFDTLDAEITNILGSVQTAQYENQTLFIDMMSQLSVGDAYYLARGHSPRSLHLLVRASEQAEELGDINSAHHFYARLGDIQRAFYANYQRAFDYYTLSLNLARQQSNKHRVATLLSLIGITRFEEGKPDFERYFDEAYELAKEAKDDLALSNILQHKGYVAGHLGQWDLLEKHSLEAIRISQSLVNSKSIAISEINHRLFFSLLNLGEAEKKLGQWKKSLQSRKKALELAIAEDNRLWQAYAFHEIGEVHHDLQQRKAALRNYRKALSIYESNYANSDVDRLKSFLFDNGYL